MKSRIILFLLFLLPLLSVAQTVIDWRELPGGVLVKTLTLQPAWTGNVVTTGYYRQNGPVLPVTVRPTGVRSGNILTVTYPNTGGLARVTYITISVGGTLRFAGTLTLLTPGEVTTPDTTGGGGGPVTAEDVVGLAPLLSAKLDAATYNSDKAVQTALINTKAPLTTVTAQGNAIANLTTTQSALITTVAGLSAGGSTASRSVLYNLTGAANNLTLTHNLASVYTQLRAYVLNGSDTYVLDPLVRGVMINSNSMTLKLPAGETFTGRIIIEATTPTLTP